MARGGGVVFGPKPRDFSINVNRKEKRLALQRALFDSVVEGKLVVLEALKTLDAPKTAEMVSVFDKIVPSKKCLLIDSDFSENQLLSIRNLNRIFSIDVNSVNALDLSRYPQIVMTERALTAFLEKVQA